MLRRCPRFTLVLLIAAASVRARAARADEALPTVHPLYVHLPDAPEDDALARAFTAAAARYKLRPVEVVDVPSPPAPRAPELLRSGVLNAQKIAFGEALRDLDAARAEVATTGGAGLSTDELSDLYLYRAIATARADWNAKPETPPTEARTQAYADYLRAAALTPARTLNTHEVPPQALADFARAAAEVRARPRGTLTVAGSADAQVSLDGGAAMAVAGGIAFRDLVYGDHLIHVTELGHVGWGAVVTLNQAALDVAIPARALIGLDGATAAMHARRMGARFALVMEPKGGPNAPVGLRLIDANGQERDAVLVTAGAETGMIDSAVMRLDETARKLAQADVQSGAAPPAPVAQPGADLAPPVLLAPPPAKAKLTEDPAAWARDHWPVLTAVGVVVLSSIILGAAVAGDR
ncbi:MAG TPA: hypothetical protein VIF57_30825 [Polyangia bacterium]|jgi:hypothetical protein